MFTYLTRLSSSRNLLYIVVKSPLKMTYQKKGLKGNSINGNLKEKGTTSRGKEKEPTVPKRNSIMARACCPRSNRSSLKQ